MIISICGTPGSGKTSVCHILSEALNWPVYSIGDLRGKMAQERGMTIDEFNKLGENESFTDNEVDEYQKSLGEKEDRFLIEGRLAWHFIPHSFKILLTCDTHEAAERIFKSRWAKHSSRNDEVLYKDVDSTEKQIKERMASDDRRYQKYYGIHYLEPTHFDAVIDTTHFNSPQETAKNIIRIILEENRLPREAFSNKILKEMGL